MPRRKGGLFLPLDVNFMDDPKIVRSGESAAYLYLAMCLACKRLGVDGVLEPLQIDRLHVPRWQKRLDILVREQLVIEVPDENGALVYGITAWYGHNDPAAEVERRKREDAARKRSPRPIGIHPDSAPVRDVEQNRVEKNRTDLRPEAAADCPHGAARRGLCALCRLRETGT